MLSLFKSRIQKKSEEIGPRLFEEALEKAKAWAPELFIEQDPCCVTQPLRDQRFEVISLAMSVVLWQLHSIHTPLARSCAQAAHDYMFLSFDRSLREGGVGDMGVSHRIKKYAQAFYGRLQRYTDALDSHSLEALEKGVHINMPASKEDKTKLLASKAYAFAQEVDLTLYGITDEVKVKNAHASY